MDNRQYDLIVMGATGFTGKLVVEYLIQHYGIKPNEFSWAIAGRNSEKLKQVKQSLENIDPKSMTIPEIVADSHDQKSLDDMTSKCMVIITTVGPYLKYGHLLVESCAKNGTHYCDLTGEVPFIKESIDQFDTIAKQNHCRIIHSCGFDSVPSDIGVLLLQQEAMKKYGKPCDEIRLYVRAMRGGFSGGTVESMFNIYDYVSDKPHLQKALKNPYSLAPDTVDTPPPAIPSLKTIKWDNEIMRWVCPFAMAGINTKVVRRSNGIMNHYYGNTFQYSEVYSFKKGPMGLCKAVSMTCGLAVVKIAMRFKLLLYVLRKFFLPSPGQGPSKSVRENGFFKLQLVGLTDKVEKINLTVSGDSDAGYSATAKMITESALSLLLEEKHLPNTQGVLTTASGIGQIIVKRLERKGIHYNLEHTSESQ